MLASFAMPAGTALTSTLLLALLPPLSGSLVEKLPRYIPPLVGRHVYIASNERQPGFFSPLSRLYRTHMLSDYIARLWVPGTPWFDSYERRMGAKPRMDAYMQVGRMWGWRGKRHGHCNITSHAGFTLFQSEGSDHV